MDRRMNKQKLAILEKAFAAYGVRKFDGKQAQIAMLQDVSAFTTKMHIEARQQPWRPTTRCPQEIDNA